MRSLKKPKEQFICAHAPCGKVFLKCRARVTNPDKAYCSPSCYYDSITRNFIGERFGRLVVDGRMREGNTTYYMCNCDCGRFTRVSNTNLRSGGTLSCGCLQRDNVSARSRKAPGHSIKNSIWNYYRRNAFTASIEWGLTREEFMTLIFGECRYCGRTGVTTTRTKYGDSLSNNGIDRVDSNRGYTSENSVTCCKACNQAKNDRTLSEFREWALLIAGRAEKW